MYACEYVCFYVRTYIYTDVCIENDVDNVHDAPTGRGHNVTPQPDVVTM
jgi:hypothetical protein